MKKKILRRVICAVVLIVVGFIFFRPMPMVGSQHNVEIHRISYNRENIFDVIDREEFLEILSNYNTRRAVIDLPRLFDEDIVWEIGLLRESGPTNIILGKNSFLYTRSARALFVHRIIDAEALMAELELLLPQSD